VKRHANTLFVTTQGTYLARKGQTVLVRIENETALRVPIHTVDGIVCFGRVSCSPWLLSLAAEEDVTISFLSTNGRFLARVVGPTSGNVLLRRAQYRLADDEGAAAAVARALLVGKVANTRTVLLRHLRDHPEAAGNGSVRSAAQRLGRIIDELERGLTLGALRGIEGDAANTYFTAFGKLVLANEKHFAFNGRSRRPPLDRTNALLSFLYTLLVHDVRSAVETTGLDPQVGFLHRDRPGRPGLALDLMEELRPVFADRLALSLINRKQVKPKGFRIMENGAVEMTDATRKTVLTAWQERKQQEITHPFLKEKMYAGIVPHVQALLLARHLRGDLDAYPPFVWK